MTAANTPLLLHREELLSGDMTWRGLAASVAGGELLPLRPGVYVLGEEWMSLTPERQLITRAHAYASVADTPPVFAHMTAAALHGAPVFRTSVTSVDILAPDPRRGSAKGIVRRRGEVDEDQLVTIEGLACTNAARTAADVARSATPESALCVADAALGAVAAPGPGQYDTDAAARLRTEALRHLDAFTRGVPRAQRILAFADGRAQLPGESISRLYFAGLGFPMPSLQVPVAQRASGHYYVDFGFERLRLFGEFDGEGKYSDPLFLAGRTPAQAVFDEKQREDWIRASTGWRLIRWYMSHLANQKVFGQFLASVGVTAPD